MKVTKLCLVALVLWFSPLCLAQYWQNILYGGLAATLVGPAPYQLELLPLNVNDTTQQWEVVNGYIVNRAYPNYVFDITQERTAPNSPVGVYTEKPAPDNLNQQWVINPDGSIESLLAPGFYLKPVFNADGTAGSLVVDYSTPPQPATNQSAVVGPLICSSTGDPHVVPFDPNGGYNPDLCVPGVQIPGDLILAEFGPTRVWEKQVQCGPNPGVYCNSQVAVQTGGDNIIINGDVVTVNGFQIIIPAGATYTTPSGATITKNAVGDYTVTVPGGTIRATSVGGLYENIEVDVTSGPYPVGGLCTLEPGPYCDCTRKRDVTLLPIAEFILSWRVDVLHISDDPWTYPNISAFLDANPSTFPSIVNFTTDDPNLLANATALCAPLASGPIITQCANLINPVPYYQACIDDVIGMEDYDVAEAVIVSYERRCGLISPTPIVLPPSSIDSIAYGAGLGNGVVAGTATSFLIQAKDALGRSLTTGGAYFAVSSTGPAPITFTVVDLGNGLYNVSYTPSTYGTYLISVKLNGRNPISNSPFTVNVAAQLDPALSTASGAGVTSPVSAGSPTTFVVQAKLANGANKTSGGDHVTVTITGGLATTPTVTDNGDGTYRVRYTLLQLGVTYTITVSLNGIQIQGSPFHVLSD